jgi:hypothetical protein
VSRKPRQTQLSAYSITLLEKEQHEEWDQPPKEGDQSLTEVGVKLE